ncbi:hypothetical protein MMC18_008214 [Xylographa bjoerkii]|nr:hypothetical protein [Xylographa bjoerkii]
MAVLLANLLTANTVASWRCIYYLAIIYCTMSLVGMSVLYIPPSPPQADYDKSRWQEVKELEYISITLYTGGLTTLLVGLTWAGTAGHPWTSASECADCVTGIAMLAACFVYNFCLPNSLTSTISHIYETD